MGDQTSSIELFKSITGADDAVASFYLDSAKGDINAAITAYMENESGGAGNTMPGTYTDAESQAQPIASSRSSSKSKSKAKSSGRGGIGTLGALQHDSDDDDDGEKATEFYTGGEKSGLGVLDPSKKKGDSKKPSNLIQEILRKAAAGGGPPPDEESSGSQPSSSFRGSGYTLGGDEEESRKVEDPNEAFRRSMATQPPKVTRVLKLWKTGFSVDDGTLYRYDDPANKEHLEAINNGRAPLSLLNVQYGQAVDVNVEKRTDEDYAPPPKIYKPFEGAGHRLGSETPPVASSASTPVAPTPSSTTPEPMSIDEGKPTTTLQIRLASGSRLQTRFNTTHTLADVYSYIRRAAPDSAGRAFTLLTPFPRKEYADSDSETIESAALMKGMLQQKF